MSKSVQAGVIQRLSPSMINAYDSSTAFGCNRRWWFKYVLGKDEPQTGNQALGTALHALNEASLTGNASAMDPQAATLFAAGRHFVEQVRPLVIGIEKEVALVIDGIPMVGYCDALTSEPRVIDWKTTSSIESYGKTPGQLAKDTQMVLYARAEFPDAPEVTLTHGQYQTKGKPLFREASVKVGRNQLDAHYETVILPLVAEMKDAAGETEAKALKPNRNACRTCPHSSYCPPDKENPLMSFFAKYQTGTTSSTSAPAPAILPPDAPKSDPALSSEPVEGFSPVPPPKTDKERVVAAMVEAVVDRAIATTFAPVEEPKRGRGRPPGSRNKPKDEAVTPAIGETKVEPSVVTEQSKMTATEASIQFEAVTVSYGVTVNMGNFNSVRFDVSMTAKHSGDADAAYEATLAAVKAKVEVEMVKILEGARMYPQGGK